MLFPVPIAAVLLLSQVPGTMPVEARGLQILWVPRALAATSDRLPGFAFRDPISETDKVFPEAQDLKGILDTLPPFMKDNGIWISSSNSFLYVEDENLQLKQLLALAKTRGISVFMSELGAQAQGWKKVDGL
jgi:hypothetical protein